jgi:hypothetical protein
LNSPVALDKEFLTELMLRGRQYGDVGHQLMERLGFSVAMWNGKEPGVSLRVRVGAFGTGPSSVNNTVILSIGRRVGGPEELFELGVPEKVMGAVVASWNPDWATWNNRQVRDSQEVEALGLGVQIGWLTYLSAPRAKLANIPEAQPMGTGVLVRASDSARNFDTERVIALHRTLGGALWPTPQ